MITLKKPMTYQAAIAINRRFNPKDSLYLKNLVEEYVYIDPAAIFVMDRNQRLYFGCAVMCIVNEVIKNNGKKNKEDEKGNGGRLK